MASLELLADAGRRLAGPLDLASVLHRASALIVPHAADWYVLVLKQADNHLRAVASEHRDARRRPALARLVAQTLFDRTPSTMMSRAAEGIVGWVPTMASGGWWPDVVCGWTDLDFDQLRTGSIVCAPLSNGVEHLGAILYARARPEGYAPSHMEVLAELALRIGLTITQAARYEALLEQLEQINEGLAIAAHELRGPAAALRGTAQLLQRQYVRGVAPDTTEVEQALARIDRQTLRLSTMIDRLMDTSTIGSGKLKLVPCEVDVRELVSNVVDLARSASPGRRVTLDAPHPVWSAVDPLRIEQVISNLVDNAFKFSPPDTPVEVALRVRQPGEAVLTVRDYGLGVPLEQRGQIFDRFVQAHRDHAPAGLGLGLYLSQQITQQHGGSLTAEYPHNGGACFVLTLPALCITRSDHLNGGEQGDTTHDALRTQSDWSTRDHSRPAAGRICAQRLNRPVGVPGVVAAAASA